MRPQSSKMITLILAICDNHLVKVPSAFATLSSCHNLGSLIYRLVRPCKHALWAKAHARYVLPHPVGPVMSRFSWCRTHLHCESSRILDSLTPRFCSKSMFHTH